MSNLTAGQAVGVVVGAVIGYFTGGAGWYLAGSILLGASAGYMAGTALDPAAADIPGAGQSATGELDVTLADEGIVIPDVLGTVKANGNIFWYGGQRVVEIKEKVSGGKGGGSKKVVTGHKYYLSWAMGLCLGPVDELISIFSNNDPVWQGNELLSNATNGATTINIDDVGTLTFFFGNSEHIANPDIASLISEELGQTYNPSYRNLCWVFFNDCLLGNYNRVPTYKFVLRKSPAFTFNVANMIGGYDYNPVHAIYYLLTTGTEIDSTMIDEESFSNVADSLALEGRGISIYFGDERQTIAYIESIITHINGIIQFEADGKFHLSLIRNDVDEENMPSFSEEDFVEPISIKRSTWNDTNNDVKVQYAKRIDVPFGDSVDPVKSGDVYVMGFLDASFNDGCNTITFPSQRSYANCAWPAARNQISAGTVCNAWTEDTNEYFDGIIPRDKDWLIEGCYHLTAMNRCEAWDGDFYAITPTGGDPQVYCDVFSAYSTVADWSTNLSLWQTQFALLVSMGRQEVIPGSVLRVYIDTSSFGGISSLEPAYSQFKAWVTATFGGLVYMEYEYSGEDWIKVLHEDLTPFGYGG